MPRSERQLQLKRLYEGGGGATEPLLDDDGVWGDAIRLQRWLDGALLGAEPVAQTMADIEAGAPHDDPAAHFAMSVEMRRAATLRLDGAGVVTAAARARHLMTRFPQASDSLSLALSDVWEAWVLGAPNAAGVEALAHEARERGNAKVTVEAQVLRGLHELAQESGGVGGADPSPRFAHGLRRRRAIP